MVLADNFLYSSSIWLSVIGFCGKSKTTFDMHSIIADLKKTSIIDTSSVLSSVFTKGKANSSNDSTS